MNQKWPQGPEIESLGVFFFWFFLFYFFFPYSRGHYSTEMKLLFNWTVETDILTKSLKLFTVVPVPDI